MGGVAVSTAQVVYYTSLGTYHDSQPLRSASEIVFYIRAMKH